MALALSRVGVAGLTLLAACGSSDEPASRVVIRAELNRGRPDFGVVSIIGTPPGSLERAREMVPSALAVYALEREVVPRPGTPALAGEWRAAGADLEFRPRFAPSGGLTYVVVLDTSALAGREAGASVVTARFPIPEDVVSQVATTVAIYPAADTLPENLLRWYLEFSRPMRPGQALAHVRLLEPNGQELQRPFLELTEELWDPSGRRLTLLFDPGRVKRGIRANDELGRPLRAGRHYVLQVDAGWTDAMGRPLARGVEKHFAAGPADHRGPDPRSWSVTEPAEGTRGAIEIAFGESLDHGLVARLLAVSDASGQPIAGRVEIGDADSRWRFTPVDRWGPGPYQILVSHELEDLAGNRPGRPFDMDRLTVAASRSADPPLLLSFNPRPERQR